MRTSMVRGGTLALVVGLTLAAGRALSVDADGVTSETNAPTTQVAVPDASAAVASNSPAADLAPPSLALSEQPTEVKLSKGAAEIVRLAQSGVGEDVMLAYVNTVMSKFNLGSDQIIYLNDLGVSGSVVKSMIQRDTTLDAQSAAATASLLAPQPQLPVPTYPPPATTDLTMMPPPQVDTNDATNPPADTGDVTVADDSGYFYNSLAPYGSWVFESGVGLCWQPTVCLANRDWRPYGDRGRWVYSDCGWYWQSDYSWGWAAFHYGRWFEDSRRGWVWAPNRVWGPAWVSWRHSDDYCGWAPLPPSAKFVPGVGITFGKHTVGANFDFGLRANQYTYIPVARMSDYAPARYSVPDWQVDEVHNHTTVANHFTIENSRVVNHSIDPREVATASGTEIRRAEIRDTPRGEGRSPQPDRLTKRDGNMVIFRPQLPASTTRRTGGATGQLRNSAGQPRSEAPLPNMILNARTAAAASVASQNPARGNYPAGSLVVVGQHNNPTPQAEAPLPNMRLKHVDMPAAETSQVASVPAVAPGNYYAGPARPEAGRPAAGFNFGANNIDRSRNVMPQTPARDVPQNQPVYVIPTHYSVNQQMNANVQHNMNEAAARYGNSGNAQETPAAASGSEGTRGGRNDWHGGESPRAESPHVQSNNEPRGGGGGDARAEVARSMQAEAAAHVSQAAAPAPAPAAQASHASSSSSGSSSSGKK